MSAGLNSLIAWAHVDFAAEECAVVVTCRHAQADFPMDPQHARALAAELLAAADYITATLNHKGLTDETAKDQTSAS